MPAKSALKFEYIEFLEFTVPLVTATPAPDCVALFCAIVELLIVAVAPALLMYKPPPESVAVFNASVEF